MLPINGIPGLTFSLDNSKLSNTSSGLLGKVELHTDVTDKAIWDAVLEKLDGMHVHASADLATSVTEVLQMENKALQEQRQRDQYAHTQQLLQLEHELSEARKLNAEYVKELAVLRNRPHTPR